MKFRACTVLLLVTLASFGGAQETVSEQPPANQPVADSQPPAPQPTQAPPAETPSPQSTQAPPAEIPSPQPTQASPEESQGDGGSPAPITVTAVPANATTPSPPTTPAPTTRPPSPIRPVSNTTAFPNNVGHWTYHDHKMAPCIVLEGAFQIRIKGTPADKKEPKIIDVPNKNDTNYVKVSGDCGADRQHIVLEWRTEETNVTGTHNTLRFQFSKEKDQTYAMSLVEYEFKEVNSNISSVSNASFPFFSTTMTHSFRCMSKKDVETDNSTLTLFTEKFQFEAFRNTSASSGTDAEHKVEFSTPDVCKEDNRVSTGVVIGIGLAIGLLVLVTIALGVYLVKKCRRNGYQPLSEQN